MRRLDRFRWLLVGAFFVFLFLFHNLTAWRGMLSANFISWGDFFWLNLVPMALLLLHAVLFLGLGRTVLGGISSGSHIPFDKKCVYSFTLGTGVWGMTVFALGLLNLYSRAVLGTLFVAGVLSGFRWIAPGWRAFKIWIGSAGKDAHSFEAALLAGFILWGLGYSFLQSLVPNTGATDSVAYHMLIPRLWADAGAITYLPTILNANWPQHAYMLYIFPILHKVDTVANGVHAFFGFFMTLAILAFGRDWVSTRARYFAAAVFATLPVVTQCMGYARNDLPWSFYVFVSGLCLVVPENSEGSAQRHLSLVVAGISAGLAASCRFQGLGACLFIGTVCFLFPRWAGRSRKEIILFGFLCLAVGSPWYIRNAIVNGNPFLPFFYPILGSENWSKFNSYMFNFESHRYANFFERISHPYSNVFEMMRHLYSPVIAGFAAQYFFLPLLALVLLAGFPGRRVFLVFAAAYAVHYSLVMKIPETWWRFSIPFIAAASLLLGHLREQPPALFWKKIKLPAFLSLLLAWIALTPAVFIRFKITPTTLLGLRSRENPDESAKEKFLKDTAFYYPISVRINQETPKNAKILLYRQVYGYYIDRDLMWGSPFDQGCIRYHELETAEDLYRKLKGLGVTHVLVWEKFMGREMGYWDFYTSVSDPKMLEVLKNRGEIVFDMDQHKLWKLI